MTTKRWIVYSVLTGFLYGATLYFSIVGSFRDGFKEGFEIGRKTGLKEAHRAIVSAYNGTAEVAALQ